jgi:plasmid maintenance system antidote protein VapI
MARNVRRTSLSEIFDPNSQYVKDLAQQFEQQYGAEFDIILRLSNKYDCCFADIDPAQLDPQDIEDYKRVKAR